MGFTTRSAKDPADSRLGACAPVTRRQAVGALGAAGVVLASAKVASASESADADKSATDMKDASGAAGSSQDAPASAATQASDIAGYLRSDRNSGPQTHYTTYADTDEIGIVHQASAQEEVDVVVAGTGIGGLMCSMIVAEQDPDAKVLVVEARGFCGGGTNYAEQNDLPLPGVDWDTALQDGDKIATDSHFLMDGRLFAWKEYEQGKNSAWLYLKHNLVLASDRHPLYEGGNGAKTIQRLVDMIDSDETYKNVEIRLNTRATALILEDDRTCTGVQVKADDQYTDVSAKAVVLFTGGMSNNLDLLQNYTNQDVCKLECEDQGHFGDGHLMAEQTAHGVCKTIALSSMMGFVPGTGKTSNLSAAVSVNPYCCFVNQDGVRFTHEDVEYSLPVEMGSSAPNYQVNYSKLVESQGRVFSIVGQNILDLIASGEIDHKGGFYGGTDEWNPLGELEESIAAGNTAVAKADSIEELADLIGVPQDNLVETVERYEQDCEAGAGDTVFLKPAEHMVALGDAPYYAFELKSFLVNTNNGIRINEKCQVVDARYSPVSGLYAGGIAVSGFNDDIYSTGRCQSVSIWSGSKAARTIVEEELGGTVADDWFGTKEYEEGDPLNQEDFQKWAHNE